MPRHCPFCHAEVSEFAYAGHIADHSRLRPNGQQAEHVTLPPEERATGALDGVPRVYLHEKCGMATVMPEDIVRSYLVNPFLYNGTTFCCGCKKYVRFTTVKWEETGQTLAEYFHQLQQQAIRDGRVPPQPSTFVPVALTLVAFSTLIGCAIAQKGGGNGGIGALWGGILGSLGVAIVWIMMRALKRSTSNGDE